MANGGIRSPAQSVGGLSLIVGSTSGRVILCHYGSRWSPPVMAKGETIVKGGITWASVSYTHLTLPTKRIV